MTSIVHSGNEPTAKGNGHLVREVPAVLMVDGCPLTLGGQKDAIAFYVASHAAAAV